MKSAPALLKIARHKIDALQRAINDADADKRELIDRVAALEARARAETALADPSRTGRVDPLELQSLAAFLRASGGRKNALEVQVGEVGDRIEYLRQQLLTAFADEKKIELLAAEAKARREREAAARDNAQLDELAIQRAARPAQA